MKVWFPLDAARPGCRRPCSRLCSVQTWKGEVIIKFPTGWVRKCVILHNQMRLIPVAISSQHIANAIQVYSQVPLAGNFLWPMATECWCRAGGKNLRNSWIFLEHPAHARHWSKLNFFDWRVGRAWIEFLILKCCTSQKILIKSLINGLL